VSLEQHCRFDVLSKTFKAVTLQDCMRLTKDVSSPLTETSPLADFLFNVIPLTHILLPEYSFQPEILFLVKG